jgi:hypothetical protein
MFDPDGYTFVKIIAIAGTLYFAVRAALLLGLAAINSIALLP